MTLILLIASLIVWHLNALEQCDWNFKLFYTRNINFGKAMLFTHMSSVDSEETAESSGNRILFLIAYLAAIIATFTQSAGESMVMFMTTTLFYQIKILEKKAESMSIHEVMYTVQVEITSVNYKPEMTNLYSHFFWLFGVLITVIW